MRRAGLAAVALLVAGAAILIGRYGVRVHTFNPDELFPVFGARHLQAHFPGGLFDAATSPRGLERLTAWMLAAVDAVTPSAASSFWVGRIVFAVSFAAVAPLAYWWARLLALPRAVAVACAALAVAGPWMVFGTSFLNVVPAWPLTTLALLAIWRGLTVPSARGDLLMLGAVVLLGLARVGNVVVAAAVPVGAIVIALRHTRSIGGSARLLWREHRVLVIAAALGLIVAAIAGRHALIGGYPVRTPAPDLDFLRQLRFGWEQVADGAALVPMIVATAWVLRSLVRPSDRAAEAFALVMGVAFLALSYAALTQAPEERYIATLAPMVAVGAAAALWRREAPWWLVGVVAVVMARVVALGAPVPGGAYGYLSGPSATWMRDVIFGRTALALPFLGHHPAIVVGVGLGLVAVVLTAVPRHVYGVAGALGACALYGLLAGGWAMDKYVTQAGLPNLTYGRQAWIDEAARHASVGILDFDADGDQPFFGTWREVQTFNPQVRAKLDFGRSTNLACCGHLRQVKLRADVATGRLSSTGPLPDLIASVPAYEPYGLALEEVAASDYLPQRVSLARLVSRDLTYAYVSGDFGGHLAPGRDVVLRVYRPGAQTCAFAAVDPSARPRLHVGSRRIPATTTDSGTLRWPLTRYAGRPWVDVALTSAAPVRLAGFAVQPCG